MAQDRKVTKKTGDVKAHRTPCASCGGESRLTSSGVAKCGKCQAGKSTSIENEILSLSDSVTAKS